MPDDPGGHVGERGLLMKTLLICPSFRPSVPQLGESMPLSVAPILGKNPATYWLEHLAARGARHVLVLVADRPDQVRTAVGDGSRWGVRIELVLETRELSVAEARAKYRMANEQEWLDSPDDAALMDHLPGLPEHPLFDSYAGWFAAIQAFLPKAATPDRIGCHEVRPGIWLGLNARVAPTAKLVAPCWIGDHVILGPGTEVGPDAILEDNVMVGDGARILRSVIGPGTLVGELTLVEDSLAQGCALTHLRSGSCLRVPDPFLLCALQERRVRMKATRLAGRLLALVAMLATSPLAFVGIIFCWNHREPALRLKRAARPLAGIRSPLEESFPYVEFTRGPGWLRRWPQLLSIVRGDMAWIGNRPLTIAEAAGLANDFERLALTAQVGLVSLADAEGCRERLSEEALAHASFYAAQSSPRLDASIFTRTLLRHRPVRLGRSHASPEQPSSSLSTNFSPHPKLAHYEN